MDKQTINTYNKMAQEYDDETIDFWKDFPRTFLDTFIEFLLVYFATESGGAIKYLGKY